MAKETRDAPGKAGVRSLGKKMDSSRHDFDEQPASSKKAGAFGREDRETNGLASHLGESSESKQKALGRMKSAQERDAPRDKKE